MAALRKGVGLSDMPLLAISVVGLLVVAAVAAFVPARRALAIPPAIAMRDG